MPISFLRVRSSFRVLSSLFVFCLAVAAPSGADVIEVPGDFASLQSAIDSAGDGDTIELAAGVYTPSSTAGFQLVNLGKSLTIRAAEGATVTLDGSGTRRVVRYENTSLGTDSVLFESIRFRNGFSAIEGLAGGVTVNRANATFVDCTFLDNVTSPATTTGGALLMFGGSEVHVTGSLFENNIAKNSGGAISIGMDSRLSVHDSVFTGNRSNPTDHRLNASGGAISNTDGELYVANSRFEANEAGCVGGAIFTLGSWDSGTSEPSAETWIANSTFVGNAATPDDPALCTFSPAGGGAHTENQGATHISASRFELNSAEVGGAVSLYRASVDVSESVFRGNFTELGGTSSLGGAILVNSNDTGGDGANNRPSGRLTVTRSYFQGRFGSVGTSAVRGGCLFGLGDTNRTFGQGGASQSGTAEQNRATVDISESIFSDCDVVSDGSTPSSGGAVGGTHLDLTISDTMFLDSDATGSLAPAGGALFVITDSEITVTGSVFADNSAGDRGGAIAVSGSSLDVSGSLFFENTVGGVGTVVFTSPQTFAGDPLDMTGQFANNVFSENGGFVLREFDAAAGPINDVRYDGNEFFEGSQVFFNTLAGALTVAELNTVVVSRNGGVGNTAKSQIDNLVLASQPELAAVQIAPREIPQVAAAGDAPPSDETFLGYAWSRASGSATLDGAPLAGTTGVVTVDDGLHTLTAGGSSDAETADDALVPAVSFTASPQAISSGQSSTLSWTVIDGTFLHLSLDRGLPTPTTLSGSTSVSPPESTTYRAFLYTAEGGDVVDVTVFVDETPSDLLFTDGFESGGTAAWTATIP